MIDDEESGPYCRVQTTSQTYETGMQQVRSGEVWGRPSRGSDIPSVKAYPGKLGGRAGIEFRTPAPPDRYASTPIEIRWYYPKTPGVMSRTKAGIDYAAIPARIVLLQKAET